MEDMCILDLDQDQIMSSGSLKTEEVTEYMNSVVGSNAGEFVRLIVLDISRLFI